MTVGDGDSRARSGDETACYLPKEAREKMSDEEQRETKRKKREGSKQGQQYVANTEKARQARKGSQAPPLKDYDDLGVEDVEKKIKGLSKRRSGRSATTRSATRTARPSSSRWTVRYRALRAGGSRRPSLAAC